MVLPVAAAAVARTGAMGARVATRMAMRTGTAAAKGGARATARAGGGAVRSAARSGGNVGRRGISSAGRSAASTARRVGDRTARRAARSHPGGPRRPSSHHSGRPPNAERGSTNGAGAAPEPTASEQILDPIQGATKLAGASLATLRGLRRPIRGLAGAVTRKRRAKRVGQAEHATRQRRRWTRRTLVVAALLVFAIGSSAPLVFVGKPSGLFGGGGATGGAYATIPPGQGIPYAEIFTKTSSLGIDPRLVAAVAWQESVHFNEDVIKCRRHSPAGARGIMQFMPGTASARGIDPCDPDEAIPGGARYLKENYDKFKSWELALAAYNAGPGAVQRYDGIPPYRETQNYVRIIMRKWAEYKQRFPEDLDSDGKLTGDYALPVDLRWYEGNPRWFTKPHHTYPAADIPVPSGTPIYAATDGTVHRWGGKCGNGLILRAGDGVEFIYCHGSDLLVRDGAQVAAGDRIMLSGWSGNVRPAGPRGAHLHLGINVNGQKRCPQRWLVAVAEGNEVPDPKSLPASGCSN